MMEHDDILLPAVPDSCSCFLASSNICMPSIAVGLKVGSVASMSAKIDFTDLLVARGEDAVVEGGETEEDDGHLRRNGRLGSDADFVIKPGTDVASMEKDALFDFDRNGEYQDEDFGHEDLDEDEDENLRIFSMSLCVGVRRRSTDRTTTPVLYTLDEGRPVAPSGAQYTEVP
jgi:hypothetical protein